MKKLLILTGLALTACAAHPKPASAFHAVNFSGLTEAQTALDGSLVGVVGSNRDGKATVLTIEQRQKLIDYKTDVLEGLIR